MNLLKYIAVIALAMTVALGCKKEVYDDTSFVKTAAAADKLSAMFDITQDNTGLVTITPNGEGGVYYEVYYGDGTTAPAKVDAGGNTKHTYKEGEYTVKLVAYNIAGQKTEATQKLTVSFKAPQNLEATVTIDPTNNFKVNVSAKALYETLFKVYFGDGGTNEIPVSFLEGETVSHTYAAVGTYTVKIVALSGGAATSQITKTVTIVDPVLLPLTFESTTQNYVWNNFDGGAVTLINNPQANGLNTSTKVAKMVKSAGQVWGGSWIGLGGPIDFSANKVFRMKVFSPRVGAKVLLKVENATDASKSYEKEVATTVANEWEDLAFDYSGVNTANAYHHIVLIFDLGTMGDGSANFTFLFDDIRLSNSMPNTQLKMPITFEETAVKYTFTDFGNAASSVVSNPHIDANNGSAKVGRTLKNNGAEVWAGSFLELSNPIDFSSMKKIKMKVWAPKSGITVKMKLENLADASKNFEVDAINTKANAWEDLTYDFSGANFANTYQRLVVFFDFGNSGTGAEYFFDDIQMTSGAEVLQLPLTFESTTLNYAFTDFDGGSTSLITNPQSSGINTSGKVVKMVKNAGQTWGGSYIALAAPIDFSSKKIMKMKVFSPRVGAKVLLKVENLTDGGISYEKEVSTTKANAWEELTFDYSAINTAKSYQKVVIIFDNGTAGDGSANFTFLFDDISQN